MNACIYLLHFIFVLLTPVFFGWVVLRRVVREHELATLLGGAVVLGLTALMALLNELRHVLEMPMAAWFTYKILLVAALALLVFTRAPRHGVVIVGWQRRPWQLGLVGLGALCTVAYFGYPASQGFLNDAWWFHYPAAVQIQTSGLFPLHHPFAVDDPLYYHYGPDLLAANWSFLLDVPVQRGFALNLVLFAPAGFLLAYGLIGRLTRNYWSALLAASFLYVGGNLKFLNLASADFSSPASLLQVFNSQTVEGLIELIFTPSHAVGVPLCLAILALLRHLLVRPSWPLAATLGLALAALTLVGEWYFFPLGLVLLIVLARRWLAAPAGMRRRFAPLFLAPLVIAAAWGMTNNTYVAGLFGHFWMRHGSAQSSVLSREQIHLMGMTPPTGSESSETPLFTPSLPNWSPPDLVPLRLNLHHLGQVPSWENAHSKDDSFVSVFSWSFLSEVFPILVPGLLFGAWCWYRSRQPLLFALTLLAGVSTLPPLVLDWGYRSTDFLRFLTAAVSYSALLWGWALGELLAQKSTRLRLLSGVLVAITLVNAFGLGLLGLNPKTLSLAKQTAAAGESLSTTAHVPAIATPASAPVISRDDALEQLGRQLGDFLQPLTKGRARVVVMVPVDKVPPQDMFPDYLKLTTLSRVLLPVGWFWNDSVYASLYRESVTDLNAKALAGLGAEWIVVSDVFMPEPPAAVRLALLDRTRFLPVAIMRAGSYRLILYRIR